MSLPLGEAPEGAGPTARAVPVMDVIAGLSRALDITEGHPTGHAARACVIGMRLGDACRLDTTARADLFHALLLKDVGCSSNAARVHQLAGGRDHDVKRSVWMTDWRNWSEKIAHSVAWVGRGEPLGRRLRRIAHLAWLGPRAEQEIFQIRCDRGAAIALDLGLSRATAEAIRAMDEHWDGGGQPARLRKDEIPLAAQIIGIAQVLEIFWQQHGVEAARDVIRRRRRRWFSPDLSRLALVLLDDAAFWQALGAVASIDLLHDVAPAPAMLHVTDAHLDRIVDAFAGVIDAKSPYTHDHSRRVADYAVAAAARLGFSDRWLVRLRRAALLHDIGKLGVSNSILDKPGALSPEEWRAVRGHTRHTLEILDAVPIFRELAVDAAAHHERLNGTGYHLGLQGEALTPSARVLAVADITDALRSDRPYRAGMPVERVRSLLEADVAAGALCPHSVEAVLDVLRATDGTAPVLDAAA